MIRRMGFLAAAFATLACAGVASGGCATTAPDDLDASGQPIVACEDMDEATCVDTPGCEPEYATPQCFCDEADGCSPCPDTVFVGCRSAGPDCGDLACTLYCEHGFVVDESGCPLCACAEPPAGEDPLCVQVIAYAIDPATGLCTAFPTPCDVPAGWEPCTP